MRIISAWFDPAYPAFYGQIAQLVEQWIEDPRVGGSIPSLATLSPQRRIMDSLSS